MAKVVSNTLGIRNNTITPRPFSFRIGHSTHREVLIGRNTKLLAWTIFLIIFIENGTLGLLPRQFYFVYRSVRISDLLIYATIVYSLFCIREYQELARSRAFIILKLILLYFVFQFIASVFIYKVNLIEYFFRLKTLWVSFMIFPSMLLIKRNGLDYLIKLILPVSVISNLLYIVTALTGQALLPEIYVAKVVLSSGTVVYRVFGGTFLGELFFLGIVYKGVTDKFKLYHLPLVVIFLLPHILAMGRGAWTYILTCVIFILLFNILKKKDFKTAVRQLAIVSVLFATFVYVLTIIPQSENVTEALGERVSQFETDVKYSEGTYGSRVFVHRILLEYWLNNNRLFGIGMHPLWVIKPETAEEAMISWGYADLRWSPFLVSYGLAGFTLAIIMQISFLIITFKILKKEKKPEFLTFFVLLLFATLFIDSFVGSSFSLISINVLGLSMYRGFYVAAMIYKYEQVLNTQTSFPQKSDATKRNNMLGLKRRTPKAPVYPM